MDTVEKNPTWYITTGANNSPTLALVFPMTTYFLVSWPFSPQLAEVIAVGHCLGFTLILNGRQPKPRTQFHKLDSLWAQLVSRDNKFLGSGGVGGSGGRGRAGAPGFLCIISVLCAPNERTNIFRGRNGRKEGRTTDALRR